MNEPGDSGEWLVISKWRDDGAVLDVFAATDPAVFALLTHGVISRFEGNLLSIVGPEDLSITIGTAGASIEYQDRRATLTRPFTGKPLSLRDAECGVKLVLLNGTTILLIQRAESA